MIVMLPKLELFLPSSYYEEQGAQKFLFQQHKQDPSFMLTSLFLYMDIGVQNEI